MNLPLAELFDFTRLYPFAIFGAIALVVWTLMEKLATGRPRAEQRLEDFRDPGKARARAAAPDTNSDKVTKMLEMASPTLSKPLQPKTEAEQGKIKERLAHAGFRRDTAPGIYMSLKVILLGLGFFFGGGTLLFFKGTSVDAIMWTVAVTGVCFFLPDIILFFIAMKRKEQVFLSLPDALDLLVVCVEAGLGLDQAMRKVAEELKKSYRVISSELAICNFQLQMGRARNEVLQELAFRTGVDDVRSLCAILIQADKFGSSIAQALRVQSDSMRTRRRQLAEERAAKTAVKLIFPLVLFIFPAIFVVLVGPAAITMVNEMFPAMQGN